MSRSLFHPAGRASALFAALTVTFAVAACHAGAAAPSTTADALHGVDDLAPALHRPDLAVLIGDVAAARSNGDWQNLRRFQSALVDRVGPGTVVAARADYQRALEDLRTADARGDARVRAAARVQLRTLCEPTSIVGAFEACDQWATTWAR